MNTRWDEVVDLSSGRSVGSAPRGALAGPRAPSGFAADGSVVVNVWLYGTLAGGAIERPIVLELSRPFTVGDVLAALRAHCGDGFAQHVVDRDGRKYSYCRVFVNGLPNEDLDGPVHDGSCPATVEMILVTGVEGG